MTVQGTANVEADSSDTRDVPLRYSISGNTKRSRTGGTGSRLGAIEAVLKFDNPESPTCAYNEFAAARIAELVGVPVASGVLTDHADGVCFASLVAASSGARLPHVHSRLARAVVQRYPSDSAALFVFDVLIGNWDRTSNVKASLTDVQPFFCGFDHGNALLMAGGTSSERSIEALSTRQTILHQHVFGAYLSDPWIAFWLARFQSIPRELLVSRCVLGYRVNQVNDQTQRLLAEVLCYRLVNLDHLCSELLELCRGRG